MATRVERILSNARLTLADPNKERWDDQTLIAILNEAQIDFCQQTQMLHERINVPILLGQAYFTLPDDCWMLTRVLYENSPIPLVTHRELDEASMSNAKVDFGFPLTGSNWEISEGTPQAIVYDRRNMLQGKIFPIPDKSLEEVEYIFEAVPTDTFEQTQLYGVATLFVDGTLEDDFGVVSELTDISQTTELSPDFGVLSALTVFDPDGSSTSGYGILIDMTDYTISSPFGTVVDITDAEVLDTFEEPYGFVSSMIESSSFITCYYLRNPTDLVDEFSDLSITHNYDIALKFYLCGQAFMNDIDTAYQQKGAAQMIVYERHVETAKRDSSHDFTRAGQFQTTYRNF